MDEDGADDGHQKVNPCAAVQGEERGMPMEIEHPHGEEHQDSAKGDGIDNHALGIELQMFLVTCPDTGDANHQERHNLTAKHVAVLIDIHEFDAVVQVNEDATPEVKGFGINGILEELQHQ